LAGNTIQFGDRRIGDGQPCYVVAEIGSNHNNELSLAKESIQAAADAGADAVKFQTFSAKDHYSKYTPGFSYLDDTNTFDLIESLELNREWHLPLKECADKHGIAFFSSPCDKSAVDDLERVGVPAHKVASFDLPDLDLISYIAKTEKPVILSTGMADWADIARGTAVCRESGNDQVILLQCTSLYPAPARLANLVSMSEMREKFSALVGYSDHSLGDHLILAAVALGACLIEKHFTLDRSLEGPDHSFAMEPEELSEMMAKIRDIEAGMGSGEKGGPRQEEREMYEKGRRSLHASCDIPAGTVITREMLAVKRPGYGLSPHLTCSVVGQTAKTDILYDQWITEDMV